jgi:fructose-1-phosphate kinase PfkB-like protein
VRPEELEILFEKLHYLSRGADFVVFAGSLPRAVSVDFYAEAIRDLSRRGVQTVLVAEGEALRRGVEAEPFLVAPNEQEAEALVGQEFGDDEDFVLGLDAIAERGARNVLITRDDGCFARLRSERTARRFRVTAPALDPVSAVGTGDALLAGFLAARLDGKSLDDSLRAAVAAGAASTLELGAGRFEPRDAGRLVSSVELAELEPAAPEAA